MGRAQNLALTSREYVAEADFAAGIVEICPPRLGEADEYGNWLLPPPKELPLDIAAEFSRLRDPDGREFEKDLGSFARRFGLLGVTGVPKDWFAPPLYGKSTEEDISWWIRYSNEVYDLLRVYRILRKAREQPRFDAEGALQEVLDFRRDVKVTMHATLDERTGDYVWTRTETPTPNVNTYWVSTGEPTGQGFSEDMPCVDAAAYVLASVISRRLEGGVSIGKGIIRPSAKSPIGYVIMEQWQTPYLLAGIYNALWEITRNMQRLGICKNPECNQLFVAQRKTREFCSPECRVTWNRKYRS